MSFRVEGYVILARADDLSLMTEDGDEVGVIYKADGRLLVSWRRGRASMAMELTPDGIYRLKDGERSTFLPWVVHP